MTSHLFIKKGISTIFHHGGVFTLLARRSTIAAEAVVLMYHRIINPVQDSNSWTQPGMYVTASTFRSQLEYLKTAYTVLPLSELIDRLKKGRSVGGCCAITFDDGWVDNYEKAFILLHEFQIPATVFLATAFIGTMRNFWPEELVHYLRHLDTPLSLSDCPLLKKLVPSLDAHSRIDDLFYDNVIMAAKKWSVEERAELLAQIRNRCRAGEPPQRQLIRWQEAEEMQKSGLITFGAHTANHVILDQVSTEEAEREIRQCRQDLKEQLDITPELFAYPNGNFTPRLKVLVRKYGFKGALTTRKAPLVQGCDLFEIPRIGIHQDIGSSVPLFRARLLLKQF